MVGGCFSTQAKFPKSNLELTRSDVQLWKIVWRQHESLHQELGLEIRVNLFGSRNVSSLKIDDVNSTVYFHHQVIDS